MDKISKLKEIRSDYFMRELNKKQKKDKWIGRMKTIHC